MAIPRRDVLLGSAGALRATAVYVSAPVIAPEASTPKNGTLALAPGYS